MKKLIPFLILMVLIPVVGATYYEDNRDGFDNLNQIQAIQSLILNTTKKAIGFNASVSAPLVLVQNTTDYTFFNEGGGSYITPFNDTRVIGDNVGLDTTAYSYLDLGHNAVENFTAECLFTFVDYASNPQAHIIGFTNETGSQDMQMDFISARARHSNSPDVYQLALVLLEGGVQTTTSENMFGAVSGTDYWLVLKRKGLRCNLEIYADETKAVLVANLTDNLSSSKKYRYSQWSWSNDIALGGRQIDYYIDDYRFTIGDGGLLSGRVYTVDLANGNTVSTLLTNSNIDTALQNSISVEFSNDNASWISLTRVELDNGTDAYNLEDLGWNTLYLKMGFKRPSGTGVCDLNEIALLYETTCSGGFGVWNETTPFYNQSVVASILGTRYDLEYVDGLTVNITETVGTPAFDARFNVSIPDGAININVAMYGRYVGNPAHNVTFEYYNHDKGAWIIIGQMPSSAVYQWFNISLSNIPYDHIVFNNTIWGRVMHYSAGNVNHFVYIDYMKVRYFAPGTAPGTVVTRFLHPFIIVLILILVAVLVYLKRRRII